MKLLRLSGPLPLTASGFRILRAQRSLKVSASGQEVAEESSWEGTPGLVHLDPEESCMGEKCSQGHTWLHGGWEVRLAICQGGGEGDWSWETHRAVSAAHTESGQWWHKRRPVQMFQQANQSVNGFAVSGLILSWNDDL